MLHSMITHSHFLSHLCTHSHSPPPPAVTLVVFTMNHGESFQMKFDSGRFTTVAQITEIMLKQLITCIQYYPWVSPFSFYATLFAECAFKLGGIVEQCGLYLPPCMPMEMELMMIRAMRNVWNLSSV